MTTKIASIEETLSKLYSLQLIDSKLATIEIMKGALPMEVNDLEDEIIGLNARVVKIQSQIEEVDEEIGRHNANIKESGALILRYEAQLNDVKNNREFDALTKEIELQKLEIQLSEKKIRDAQVGAEELKTKLDNTKLRLDLKNNELEIKKVELEKILAKTEKEEKSFLKKAKSASKHIESRLLSAYNRIRNRYINSLAVVTVERDACGGCYARIPPQVQIEIAQRKKIIACEHCGRVLIDDDLASVVEGGKKK